MIARAFDRLGVSRLLTPPAQMLPMARVSGLMPWVIAIMVFLGALALAGGVGLASATLGLERGLSRSVTVQVPVANPDARAAQAMAIARALTPLAGVADVRVVPDSELVDMLKPWLGETLAVGDVPIPALVEVTLDEAQPAGLPLIRERVAHASPAARVEAGGAWLDTIGALFDSLRLLAGVVALLVLAAAVAAVALATRAGLSSHMATIEVVHLMGAEDRQIARLFRRRAGYDGLIGGALGLSLAVIVIQLLGARAASVGSGLLGTIGLPPWGWVLLCLLVPAAGALSYGTAHWTVMRSLKSWL